ncbi:MAG: hypothetical protein UT32_C0021G0007 [Parcubacteria group bacterium GW2011_GWC2_39_14]|nr:MAG: hypothetical protein UT32_C0021G0007 [Parcubacteria group bacterium GW2011_GWC2_39_14]KKR53940.1 MAG: hypothetical protein UT91_C0022G0007 [Parcubacteria group bacterium GW2011_GWA2_40_23]
MNKKKQIKDKRGLIIFDLDGTLYKLRGGSYSKSPLKKKVISNVKKYISVNLSCGLVKARNILKKIQREYGEEISIGLEKEFGLDRYNYFNTVWNISAHGLVRKTRSLRVTLLKLKRQYRLVILSDAPKIWIHNVLIELQIIDIFKNAIFSGEGDLRKGSENAFSNIVKLLKVKPRDCIAVGDQERTDIIPAKKLGMRTIFVHRKNVSSSANANIKEIQNLADAISRLDKKYNF